MTRDETINLAALFPYRDRLGKTPQNNVSFSLRCLCRLKHGLRWLYFNPPSHQSARSSFKAAAAFSSSSSVA